MGLLRQLLMSRDIKRATRMVADLQTELVTHAGGVDQLLVVLRDVAGQLDRMEAVLAADERHQPMSAVARQGAELLRQICNRLEPSAVRLRNYASTL